MSTSNNTQDGIMQDNKHMSYKEYRERIIEFFLERENNKKKIFGT